MGDRITKAFPPAVHGQGHPAVRRSSTTEHPRYSEAGELRAMYEAEAEVKQVIDTAPRASRA